MDVASNHHNFLVPAREIQHRIEKLQAVLQKMNISVAYVDYITDLFYFSGSNQKGVLLIPASDKPVYIIKKSLLRAEAESPLTPQPYPGRKGMQKKLRSLVGSKGRLGMSLDVTTALTYQWLTSILEGREIQDISLTLRLQRAVKSPWESEQIRRASSHARVLFQEMRTHISVGKTELEPYPSSPAGAGWKKIGKDETVFVDMVNSYNGYFSDHTRTFFTGQSIPVEAKKAHTFCMDVLALLEEKLSPGSIASAVYEEVQNWVQEHNPPEGFMGAGENKVKFFGHGIGVELDEFPIIARKIDIALQPGMVVAMEPKAFLTGIGPVGVENTYIVTDTGNERYIQTPMEIIPLI